MNIIRHTLEIDTDARLREMADEHEQDVAAMLAEPAALLDSVVDIAEDRRRLEDFRRSGTAVPLNEVKDWVASWGSAHDLPRPVARRIG